LPPYYLKGGRKIDMLKIAWAEQKWRQKYIPFLFGNGKHGKSHASTNGKCKNQYTQSVLIQRF